MTGTDALLSRVTEAAALIRRGEQDEARRRLTDLWERVGAAGDPLCRCLVAHHLADLQADPDDELAWDLRALEAAGSVTGEQARRNHSLSLPEFYPSLHLNAAESYRRLGRLTEARAHLAKARTAATALPDDGHGQLIRSGIDRLAGRLPAAD